MEIKDFAVEQWMNEWETKCTYNVAETCVYSLSLDQLFELTGGDKAAFLDAFATRRLTYGDIDPQNDLSVTNSRHYEALTHGSDSLRRAIDAIQNGVTADFIAQDIRETLHHLGTITGAITPDTLLHNIFSHFCIGK